MEANKPFTGAVRISSEIIGLFPDLVVGYLDGNITNDAGDPVLWNRILERSKVIAGTMDEESIRQVEGIKAGKQAYRQLGKDPNRYRLSAEALMRRAVKGKELYSISTAVDLLNFVSLTTGITIGGFDGQKVIGDIELGIGSPGEEFIAIGRGPLNVENLPVYRDDLGAIGNPTSDSERTQITRSTEKVLMLITGFYGNQGIDLVLNQLTSLLTEFCNCTQCRTKIILTARQ
ncbi:MAG: phenylalanine--tRNA ligase beta subunit-related protein [Bacteroidales bacterium]